MEKIQVVHLILAEGGTNCEIVRHLTKDCVPGKDNDHPVMPEKAAFKELLLSQNHSQAALDDYIQNSVPYLCIIMKNLLLNLMQTRLERLESKEPKLF